MSPKPISTFPPAPPSRGQAPDRRRVVIIQYAGDFREAYYRLEKGGPETYFAQRYSVGSVLGMTALAEEVTTVCLNSEATYEEVLAPGVRAAGCGFKGKIDYPQVLRLLDKLRPTRLIARLPAPEVIRWAVSQRVPTLGLFADSFARQSLRQRLRNRLLVRNLNHPSIECVANHGMESCRQLRAMGVSAGKLIPWDYEHVLANYKPKSLPPAGRADLVFVGTVSEQKGVGDLLQALPFLHAAGIAARLKVAGGGDVDGMKQRAEALGISQDVEFLGLVPHSQVAPLMRAADVVVIPSRHEYPEGFPLTIYEALSARTPIAASDHPMFRAGLRDRESAMIFPAGDSAKLAESVRVLLSNARLYELLSGESAATWRGLQLPVKMATLMERWVRSSPEDVRWIREHTLGRPQ